MVTIIFGVFLIVGIVYGFISSNINLVNSSLISSGGMAIDIALKLVPLLCLWLGVMKIAEDSGLLRLISKVMSRVIHPLFPELKRDGDAIGYLGANIVMNMFGLGNAATPFGLKAMRLMQEDNPKKDTVTRSMITFLVMNTASVTIIPTTVISFRVMNGSKNPTEVVGACIMVTIFSCLFGLIMDRLFYFLWRKFDD